MASITLRPVGNITVNHNTYENGSSSKASAYTMIDDVVSDESATTIGHKHHGTSVNSKTSSFRLGGADYNHLIYINSITIYHDYWCDNPASKGSMQSISASVSVTVNGQKSSAIVNNINDVDKESDSGSWKTLSYVFNSSNFQVLEQPFDSISAAGISFEISTGWKCSSSAVTNDQAMYVSQAYAVADYTDAYTFTAIGNETTDVVSPGIVRDSSTVIFEAIPRINHTFLGWYSDSGHTILESDDKAYRVTVQGSDKTVYANSKKIEAINVFYKKNGNWIKLENMYIKESNAYKKITAKELSDALYFTERTYLSDQSQT